MKNILLNLVACAFIVVYPIADAGIAIERKIIRFNDLLIDAAGEFNSKDGSANVKLSIKNNSRKLVTINPYNMHIAVSQGWRSPLLNTEIEDGWEIEAGQTRNLSVNFNPVNSMALYQLVQMHGDFESDYVLTLAFESGNSTTIPIKLNRETYRKYIESEGYERQLNLHLPIIERDQFVGMQTLYMQEMFATIYDGVPSISATPEQQVIQGLAFRWRLYQEGDAITVGMQFVNHNRQDVNIQLDQIRLMMNNKVNEPQNSFTTLPNYMKKNLKIKDGKETYTIKAGKRFAWKFRYPGKINDVLPILELGGIRVKGQPIYANALSLKPVDFNQW